MKAAKKKTGKVSLSSYMPFLQAVKNRIRAAQTRAALSANTDMICLYWDIGNAIIAMQKKEGWGAGVIPRLARDIENDLPEVKGFSERNLKYMIRFAGEYGSRPIVQQAVALLPQPVAKIVDTGPIAPQPAALLGSSGLNEVLQQAVAQLAWGHNVILMEKVKNLSDRLWYARQTIEHGWSRSFLAMQIDSQAHKRQGKAVHNYCNWIDQRLRHSDDKPSIGLILCQDKNHIVAEYALKGVEKAIGISTYRLTRALPKELQSSLPTVEEMESELLALTARKKPTAKRRRKCTQVHSTAMHLSSSAT